MAAGCNIYRVSSTPPSTDARTGNQLPGVTWWRRKIRIAPQCHYALLSATELLMTSQASASAQCVRQAINTKTQDGNDPYNYLQATSTSDWVPVHHARRDNTIGRAQRRAYDRNNASVTCAATSRANWQNAHFWPKNRRLKFISAAKQSPLDSSCKRTRQNTDEPKWPRRW
jgi:hypothetical protein